MNKNVFAYSGFRWFGVVILLLSFFLVSSGIIGGTSVLYNSMNAVGSIALILNSLSQKSKDWAIAVFNVIWLAIAVVNIFRILF